MAKKTVFLTGGTGNMGWAAVQEMLKHPNEINIKMLARKSPKNEEKLKNIMAKPNVQVVWGDLGDYDSILEGVTGSDYVLHIGGMVSPTADWKPYRTQKTNIGAAQNITKAVLAQPNADDIKVAYIGTVAETGGRNYPIHWGRCGDPIKISIYDHYAISKTVAERVFVESGIKNWVVMRQSGILYPNILKNMDPIMFHVPINGVLEWCTVEDSGRLMCNLVLEDEKAHSVTTFGITSSTSVQVSSTEFLTMNLSVSFSVLSVLQALKNSLTLTGLSQRTSTVSSMLTATSSKNSSTSERTSLLRITSTDLLTMLNSTSKYQDTFQRILLLLVLSHS